MPSSSDSRSSVSRDSAACAGALRQAKKVERGGWPRSWRCSSVDKPHCSAMRPKARNPAEPIWAVLGAALVAALAAWGKAFMLYPELDFVLSLVQFETLRQRLAGARFEPRLRCLHEPAPRHGTAPQRR